MFPCKLPASVQIEAVKIRVGGVIFEADGKLVAVRNSKASKGVGNDEFGLGAHSVACGGLQKTGADGSKGL